MNEIHNLDENHFLVLNSNGTGRTTFIDKSLAI
jgi:hypothetical protein